MKKKTIEDFFEAYTDFQCLIIAQLNKMDFSGVSAMHYNMIEFLYRNGPATSGRLAKKFLISMPAISRHIKTLLSKELVTQQQDKIDRRLFYLDATEKGKELINSSENIRKNITTAIAGVLTADELEQFTRACKKIVAEIEV